MNQISILGCGWLGFPLATALQQKGYSVKGSTTSHTKISTLKAALIKPYLINLTEKEVSGNFFEFVEGSETLIINIPPKLKNESSASFSEKIKVLIQLVMTTELKQLLFVSSISVFNDLQGQVNEMTSPQPETLSGKELLQSEQLLSSNQNFKTTILRFGGLIDEKRHPINFLAGKVDVTGGNAPINLVHLEDCIGIILAILEKNYWGKIVHGVYPLHTTKKEYYTHKAKEKGLIPPKYKKEITTKNKVVLSAILSNVLDFKFQKTP